jgi:glucosamine-6-phosphate deaminase
MNIDISQTKAELGYKAASRGAEAIREAILAQGQANIVLASAASQFEVVAALVEMPDIDWSKVQAFHLDEYAGMEMSHPASFRKFLQERFVEKLPQPLGAINFIAGEADLKAECSRLAGLMAGRQIDVAFIGIGENGHLAFNDPPADFETTEPYIVVQLDEACRSQQIGEGWFPTLESVPKSAISMPIRQIMSANVIVCCVPDTRKAEAVRNTVHASVSPAVPATILQLHPDATLFLDTFSAALLEA